MVPLAADAVLPLTCTREGVCCRGHTIWVNPWEVALLARGAGLTPREFRAAHLDCRGTRLLFNGAPDARGRASCSLYRDGAGCSVHPHRPLTCRMYPLGRARIDGQVRYYHPGTELPCIERCPTVTSLPRQRVDDYLLGQGVANGEAAHDAYARVIYGLVAVAGRILSLAGPEADPAVVHAFLRDTAALPPEKRCEVLPDAWVDLATIPEGLAVDSGPEFALAHGERIASTIRQQVNSVGGSLTEAATLHIAVALHLAPVVGAEADAMATLLPAVG